MSPNRKFFGVDFRGFVSNGLQELQSIFVPGAQYVQLGSNPTLGTVTMGELTHEKMEQQRQQESPQPPEIDLDK